ncbi:hypothetical protein CC1G_02798 [Coprinopsis cinerea okayama7|uniref:Uncharacterized protein n=1 Tax=Coprinopsis cinerea (strain Okayama-7 / 130 / ATCC MYA-4618 / FGSC 9003) TaxID=240176 RepID=A8N028_COPC7|nr:hypothetical protein CC1G_02798 [Coprinopsis cinerea okayama7\|eukprot:XP_001828217.2 hypothetical protein CC1G_02798 [Coprinopsis cinerea okayama7\
MSTSRPFPPELVSETNAIVAISRRFGTRLDLTIRMQRYYEPNSGRPMSTSRGSSRCSTKCSRKSRRAMVNGSFL